MIKYICDGCGREIKNQEVYTKVKFIDLIDGVEEDPLFCNGRAFNDQFEDKIFCVLCKRKISNFVKELVRTFK